MSKKNAFYNLSEPLLPRQLSNKPKRLMGMVKTPMKEHLRMLTPTEESYNEVTSLRTVQPPSRELLLGYGTTGPFLLFLPTCHRLSPPTQSTVLNTGHRRM